MPYLVIDTSLSSKGAKFYFCKYVECIGSQKLRLFTDSPKEAYVFNTFKEADDYCHKYNNSLMEEIVGDLISRSALIENIKSSMPFVTPNEQYLTCKALDIIENAPTVCPKGDQIAWEQGYECGYAQAKKEIRDEQTSNS